MRDWREDKPIRMDPHLIDLLWEVHREVGAKEPIWIVCGYRSPSTNTRLRRRSRGSRQVQPAHARQGHRLLHSRRAARATACRRSAGAARRRGLLSLIGCTLRAHGYRQRAPLAADAGGATCKRAVEGSADSRAASDPRGTALARGEIQRPDRKPGLLAKLRGGGKDADEEADAAAAEKPAPSAKTADATPGTAVVEPNRR